MIKYKTIYSDEEQQFDDMLNEFVGNNFVTDVQFSSTSCPFDGQAIVNFVAHVKYEDKLSKRKQEGNS